MEGQMTDDGWKGQMAGWLADRWIDDGLMDGWQKDDGWMQEGMDG